jgi:signal recognition particle subunit SRP54
VFENLTNKLSGIFGRLGRKGRLSESDVEDVLREVRVALLEADVNLAVAKSFVAAVKDRLLGQEVWENVKPDEMIVKTVFDELVALLGSEPPKIAWAPAPPTVILMCGLQGSGKTTTSAKLAVWLQAQGKTALLAACDTQRPAAITQLQVLGESVGAPVSADLSSKDPVAIARAAIAEARRLFLDAVIVDTAGRLQIDDALMQELQAVDRATQPTEVLFVADSTTGQEAVNVAKAFDERLGITGLIFTKLDGDTRGGAVLSVRAAMGKPVRFIGVGESTDALEPFIGDRIAQRLLGYGDLMGLVERAQVAIDREDARELEESARGGTMDFEMMLKTFKTVRKMGSLRSVLKMLPGASRLPAELLDGVGEAGMARIEAIILSMTPYERRNPDILSGSRKRRIAAGSGTSVQELNRLVKQLEQMRRQMKTVTRMADTARARRKGKSGRGR